MANLSTKTGLPSFTQDQSSFVNYFVDPGFERGANGVIPAGWSQYADAAGAVPVDGTGGTAVPTVTMLCSNSSPIRGALSAVITKDAVNRQGVGYSYPFTISQADKGVTAGVEIDIQTSASYVSGDMVFMIYDVTNSILITPRNVPLPKMDNYGKFISDYGLTAGTSYRFILHIATVSALAYTVKIDTMVNTTTRVSSGGGGNSNVQTAVGMLLGGAHASSTVSGKFTKDGQWMHLTGLAVLGGANIGTLLVTLPPGHTIDTSALTNGFTNISTYQIVGTAVFRDQSPATEYSYVAVVNGLATTQVYFYRANGTDDQLEAAKPVTAASGDTVYFELNVPIVEWAGSGANFGPSSQLEYFSHNGTTTVNDWSLIPNIAGGTGNTAVAMTPAAACQPGDTIAIQIKDSSGAVYNIFEDPYPFISGTSSFAFGILLRKTPNGGVTANFGNGGANPNNGLGAAGTDTWASLRTAGYMYRIRKANPTAPVGIVKADANQGGYVAPRKGSYDLTPVGRVTGTNWTTVRGVAIYYQDQDGNHRLKFNIRGTLSVLASTTISMTITGILTKNLFNNFQAISAFLSEAGVANRTVQAAYMDPNAATFNVQPASGNFNAISVSGDIELDSKPTWA